MLHELYQYAIDHELAAQPGFKPKKVKAYVSISLDGEFLAVVPRDKDAPDVYAPDIGSAANGTRYCNFLIEKAKIPLKIIEDESKDKNIPIKHDFFLSMLEDGGEYEPKFLVLAQALRDDGTRSQIVDELIRQKLKPADPISFRVDGVPLETSEAFLLWWGNYRSRFAPETSGEQVPCLITGEPTAPLATVPKVSGLFAVGGHSSGDAFLCFDKDAFQSYGLKKSANASVSEEAMTAVNAALTELIRKADTLGGAKMVHWYSCDVSEDPLDDLFDGFGDAEETDAPAKNGENKALTQARSLIAALSRGETPILPDARYYILPLSGAGGRMMVRGWYEGRFETLCRNIALWFSDLRLVSRNGKGLTKPPKLSAVCVRLLKPGGDGKKVWERVDEELKSLSSRLLDAILTGTPLPDEAAVRTLRYLRSASVNQDDKDEKKLKLENETIAFQILKAWLLRRQRAKGETEQMGESKSAAQSSPAYICGAMLAVYGEIQKKSSPDVNISVVERYFGAASTTPAFVLGRLAQLSVHHLRKLDQLSPGLAVKYRKELEGLAQRMGDQDIPTTLSVEQQAQFALGYYQQRAALYQGGRNQEEEKEDGDQ